VVTSDHVTTMAVTAFDPSQSKTACYTRKLHCSLLYRTGVIADGSFTLL